jgi:hypothetical protein
MIKVVFIFLLVAITVLCYFLGLRFEHADLIETFFGEASGAAAGGFVGALILLLFREVYVRWLKEPKHIKTYYLADNKKEIYGGLIHRIGKRIEGATEIKGVLTKGFGQEVVNKGIWEVKIDDSKPNERYIFFGPYSFDLTEPGTYEVSFYYFGRGFKANVAASDNPMLLHLDIWQKVTTYDKTETWINGDHSSREVKEMNIDKVVTKSKKYLYYSDFLNENETKEGRIAKIRFHFEGVGEFEYRAYIPYNPSDAYPNIKKILGEGCRIFFFKIEIKQIFDISVPNG